PGGVKLKRSKIRGVKSEGMLCSEVELGIAEESPGIMILPEGTEPGLELKDAIGGGDVFFDVSILPNRPDCISIKGLAREIAAVVGADFTDKKADITEGSASSRKIQVTIEDEALSGRYTARIIEGVKVGESPDWLKERLTAHGLRAINNVVDATNYILLELGQPLHAFDLAKISGDYITVRTAKEGESITTIDEVERTLTGDMLVIADEAGAQAIAGVMGGSATEVDENTTDLLLESAHFLPSSVRRTSRLLGLSSDSSYRFERGVDISGVALALDKLTELIVKLAGGEVKGTTIDEYPRPVTTAAVALNIERASRFLDMELTADEVIGILSGLGMEVTAGVGEGVLLCTPPAYRLDIQAEEDLLEEVARIKGYDNVPAIMPTIKVAPSEPSKLFLFKRKVRELLSGDGFLEAVNYSFVSLESASCSAALGTMKEEEIVRLINPLSDEQSVMRPSLLPSLLSNLSLNVSHRSENMRLFEVSPVFSVAKGRELPKESTHLSAVIYGKRTGAGWNKDGSDVDFYDIKGTVERLMALLGVSGELSFSSAKDSAMLHPGRSSELTIDGSSIGLFGMLHPDITAKYSLLQPTAVMELDMDVLIKFTGAIGNYVKLPKYPSSERDIAFVVDSQIPYSDILRVIRGIDTKLIENV
ncbi:MAG: phenylalanine--tRNA ligase subunit beta, partial [Deltaproteobacteria bacterium]|nr:phenylalanine--tRNA ligase subunit beta [Deltaproteobacteria bacterium]